MSRSVWASTEPDTLAKAAVRGAGRGIRLVHRGRLEHSGLGVPRPTKRLLRIAIALVPLASAPAAFAAPGSRQHHTPSHTTKIHRAAPARTAAPARSDAGGASQARLVRELRGARVVLSAGSGYGTAGGSTLVRALQGRLAAAGYASGPIDGRYGPRTEGTVRRYQAAHGLVVDGIAGPKTLAEVTAPTPALYPTAGYATAGAAPVRALQRRLARAGYSPGPIDGLFGPRTEHAVRRLQAAHGLKANGIAGGPTLAALRGSRSTARPRSLPHRTRRPHQTSPKPSSHRPAASRPTPVPRRTSHAPTTSRPRTAKPTSGSNISWELPAGILAAGLLLIAGTWYERRRRVARPDVSLENPRHADPAELPDGNGRMLEPNEASPMVLEAEAQKAIERGEAVKAFNLAVLLEKQHDHAGARAAYEQADEAGHPGAACNLGVMMELDGELRQARAAYERADERGDANGAFNLGALLEEQAEPDAARAAYERADERGHAEAATNLGVVLEIQGDNEGARAAYERAEQRGDPHGAANLGALLEEQGDRDGARAAYRRAKRMKQRPAPDTVRVTPHRAEPGPQPTPAPSEGGGAA
jgi:peptidoglycan hydrolase-like protein with peptidoglycan-binding domain/TPR repeat protein